MEMPKPGAGHAKLQQLTGYWEGEETMHPSPWDPKGGKATGRTHGRLALNGFAVISDYEQVRDGVVTFSGHGVMTFDAESELYSLHWFDCMGCAPEVFTGRFEGHRLTVAHGGPGMHARLTYDLTDAAHMLTRMDMSQDGAQWNTLFEGRYKKK